MQYSARVSIADQLYFKIAMPRITVGCFVGDVPQIPNVMLHLHTSQEKLWEIIVRCATKEDSDEKTLSSSQRIGL